MADRRITQLVEVIQPNTVDFLPIVNTNITKKVTLDNAVGSSTFSTNKINLLFDPVPSIENSLPPTDQFAVQSTDGSAPKKVRLQNIYPRPSNSNTISTTFNINNRNLTSSIILGSINQTHFGTQVVQTTAIQDGAITEAKIDPNAKIRGATGGGTDRVFYENDQQVTTDYAITLGKNAMTAGPITVQDGVTVTVLEGSTWTVV
jgi:hypothetical protein